MENKVSLSSALVRLTVISVVSIFIIFGAFIGLAIENKQIDDEKTAIFQLDRNLLQLDVEMIQARRSEKDFLLRRDEKYIERHAGIMADISGTLTQIRSASDEIKLTTGARAVDQISEKLDAYNAAFGGLVDLKKKIGLDPNSGLEGELRKAVHAIETVLRETDNNALMVKILMMRRHEKDFIMRVDQKYIDRLNARVTEFQAFPNKAFGTADKAAKTNALLLSYQSAFSSFAEWTKSEASMRMMLSELYAEARPYVAELRESADKALVTKLAQVEKTRTLFLLGTALTILIGLTILIVWMRRTSRTIATSLGAYANALSELAEGRTIPSPPHSNIIEIDRISNALNALKENELDRQLLQERASVARKSQDQVTEMMRNSLGKLAGGDLSWQIERPLEAKYDQLRLDYNSAVAQLKSIMVEIVRRADSIHDGAREITQAADNLSNRTENQATTLEETAAALVEMTASIKSASEGADKANHYVSTARQNAEISGDVVRETVKAMSEIEGSSKQISQIISVIDDIAFQTNLLALNAGVEAARAGDAGRGFAVVASEVRALAQRSSDAAKEIKHLISTSSSHVDRGVALVGKTGIALNEIVEMVANISSLVSAITVSSKEQSTGLAEINSAITQLDQVAQQNASMVEESTIASHELTRNSEELSQLTSHFRIYKDKLTPSQKRLAHG